MSILTIATYRPAWSGEGSARVPGRDEDVVTMAVDAALAALGGDHEIERLVLITRQPDYIESGLAGVVSVALDLSKASAVEERLGGGPAVLDAVAAAAPGTLVVAVSPQSPAGAAAVLVGETGASATFAGRVDRSLPIQIRTAGAAESRVYDDPRLLRERGWRPAIDQLKVRAEGTVVVAGVPAREAPKFGFDASFGSERPVGGAAEPLFAVAEMIERGVSGRIIAVEGGAAAALDIALGDARVVRKERAAPLAVQKTTAIQAEIPISLAAYERAFDAKLGLRAARCSCGELSYPPRTVCLACGAEGTPPLESLPRDGEVYTVTTIHTPIPGMVSPYSLAIVSLGDSGVRVLVHVTDAPAASVGIGRNGTLVLRRVATREGIPDYGYGFRPDEAFEGGEVA